MKPRSIPGFPGYVADAQGNIYSVGAGRNLSPRRAGKGYRALMICGRQVYAHRLVAFAFHGEPPTPQHEVAHANGDRADNRPDNVSWKTRSANHMDKHRHGTMSRPGARLTAEQAQIIRSRYTPRKGVGVLAAEFGIGPRQVRRIAKEIQWKNHGCI